MFRHMIIEMIGGGGFNETLLPKIKNGNQRLLRESFRTAHNGNLENAHTYLAFGSECPPNAADTYAMLLEHGIDTAKSFRVAGFMNGMADQAIEQALWTGSRRAQSPDAAALHARVLAEYLRYRLGRDGTYQPVLSDIFADKNGRSAAMDYMKRVQHALVDHVAISGKDLPLNRGAALLHELRDEMPGSDLWTHKIAEIGFRRFARANNFTLTFDKA